MKIPDFFLSATGEGLSLRTRSFLESILPVLVLVLKFTGNEIPGTELNSGSEAIVTVAAALGALIAGVRHVYGWVRRNFYKQAKMGKFSV